MWPPILRIKGSQFATQCRRIHVIGTEDIVFATYPGDLRLMLGPRALHEMRSLLSHARCKYHVLVLPWARLAVRGPCYSPPSPSPSALPETYDSGVWTILLATNIMAIPGSPLAHLLPFPDLHSYTRRQHVPWGVERRRGWHQPSLACVGRLFIYIPGDGVQRWEIITRGTVTCGSMQNWGICYDYIHSNIIGKGGSSGREQ